MTRRNISLLSVTWNDQCDNLLKRRVCDLALQGYVQWRIQKLSKGGTYIPPDSAILEIVRMRAKFIRTRAAERTEKNGGGGLPGPPPLDPPLMCDRARHTLY